MLVLTPYTLQHNNMTMNMYLLYRCHSDWHQPGHHHWAASRWQSPNGSAHRNSCSTCACMHTYEVRDFRLVKDHYSQMSPPRKDIHTVRTPTATCSAPSSSRSLTYSRHSRMCAKQEPVNGVVLPLRPGDVRQPLCCQTGPLEGVRHHKIVEKRSVLFPYLVLFVHYPLFHRLVIGCVYSRQHKCIRVY